MNEIQPSPPKGNIIIVDDVPANLRLLANMLTKQGYFVRPIRDSRQALSFILTSNPDLILLDIKMPHLNGYEVCEQLKADARTQHIPVIFLSALNEALDKVKAFAVGGVDYITKPFQIEEVLARVETHLKMQRLQQTLLTQNSALEQSNQELAELNASKDKLFAIISHDLRSPFQGLLGNAEWLAKHGEALNQAEVNELTEGLYTSAQLAYNLLDNLLEWSLLQRGKIPYQPDYCSLKDLADPSLKLLANKAAGQSIRLVNEVQPDTWVNVDHKMIDTVFRNLVSNAIKFTPAEGEIRITNYPASDNNVEVAVIDTGIGISPQNIEKLFQPDTYFTMPGIHAEKGTGLGFTICREMISRNGGRIWVESEEGKGTQVKFTLPQAQL